MPREREDASLLWDMLDVRQEKLWRVAMVRVPELIEQLEKLIPPLP